MKSEIIHKNFLVTGGAGFIGSHLIDRLLAQGHTVQALDNLSTGQLSNIAHHLDNPNFHFARADITDAIVLDRMGAQADIVVHLAAAVGVQLIIDHPVRTIETNINGTERVLQTALRYGCRVVIASTSEVYGKGTRIPFGEDDDVLLGATSKHRWAYAASKMVDEFLAFAYEKEFGADVLVVRFFNTVGPRQTGRYGMVVPRFVRQALRNEPITVYGDGTQSRCFGDVQDVVRGVLGLIEHHESSGTVYNLGSSQEISITALAQRVIELTNSESEIIYIPYDEAYAEGFEDMQRRVPSTRRVNELIQWKHETTLDETLARVIAFERQQMG